MVKHVVLAVAMIGGLVLVDQAEARHGRRGGCAGGACYSGGYYGGCPGGVCGVPVGPSYPVYPSMPMKAGVAPAMAPVAVAPAQPASAPVPAVAAPGAQRYYYTNYTNTGRFGWRRGR